MSGNDDDFWEYYLASGDLDEDDRPSPHRGCCGCLTQTVCILVIVLWAAAWLSGFAGKAGGLL